MINYFDITMNPFLSQSISYKLPPMSSTRPWAWDRHLNRSPIGKCLEAVDSGDIGKP